MSGSGVLRIGVLGAARIAEQALIRPASAVPAVTVAAIAARDPSRADAFALQHGIPVSHPSYDALLADPEVDAVYVPLPNALHAPWTLRAIAAGKHVLCEKPFSSNAAEAADVADAAAGSGLVVMEAMHYRYHPLVRRMVSLLRSGAIGRLRTVQCWTNWPVSDPGDIRYDYAAGGGALMDGGCYAVDCLRLIAGEPSVAGALADPLPAPQDAVDRAMAARLTFPAGVTGWFESSFIRAGEFRADVYVTGDEGTLWLQNFVLAHEGRLSIFPNGAAAAEEAPDSDRAGDTTFAWQLRAFAAAVQDGAPVETTAENATATMRVIDDVYRAASLPVRGARLRAFAAVQQHLRDEVRVVGHRHVPTAGQRDEPRVRQPPHGDAGLARRQQAVPAAPGDGHRHARRDGFGEGRAVGQHRRDRVPGPEESNPVGHGLVWGDVGGPADEGALDDPPAERPARQRGKKRADRHGGQLPGHEHCLGVTGLPGAGPEPGRGQPGNGRGPAVHARHQGEGAAQGVAADVRAVQAEFVEEREDFLGDGADRRAAVGPQRRRLAVAGQVHRDDGAARHQQVKNRLPRLPPVPQPVQQHQRGAGAVTFVSQLHPPSP
jgi:predicted dehydrogenase